MHLPFSANMYRMGIKKLEERIDELSTSEDTGMAVELKDTFNNVVTMYDAARPKYPAELLQDVKKFAGKAEFDDGLEVGAGTGQATDLFIGSIDSLDIVEVGDKQVEYLTEKYKGRKVNTYQAYFEDFNATKQYDLIFSATAFHWVDSKVGYPKAWDMLKDGGSLAVFWHMSSVTLHDSGIFAGLNGIKKKYLPNEPLGYDEDGIEGVRQKRISQIRSGNHFGIPQMHEYRWIDTYDADRYSLLLESYSSTQTLDDEQKKAYLAEVRAYINANGGAVHMPQHVMLYLVKKG